jgi:hypothetical protein
VANNLTLFQEGSDNEKKKKLLVDERKRRWPKSEDDKEEEPPIKTRRLTDTLPTIPELQQVSSKSCIQNRIYVESLHLNC